MKLADLLQDFAFISLLILIAFILRNKIKLFQRYFIPTALIAGFLGLILSSQVLGKFSPIYIPFTESLNQWAGVLVIFVCATMFLGLELGEVNRDAMVSTFLAGTIHQMQMLTGLGIAFVFGMFIKLPYAFGYMPVWGFYAGHGNAATVGTIMQDAGFWTDAVAVGVTFATIGILAGIVGGMILINIGAKKGYTKVQMSFESMPAEQRTGYIPEEKRTSIGSGVTNSSSLDPLAFQLAIVGIVIVVGTQIRNLLLMIHPMFNNFPLVGAVLVSSMIIGAIINKTSLKKYVDKGTMSKITGTTLEFMITAAIATTSLTVFATYLVPIIVSAVVIILLNMLISVGLGRRWYKDNWFEKSVGLYGQVCGILATGLMLVKVVDPDNETGSAQCISASSTLGYSWQIPYMIFGTLLIWTNPSLFTIISAGFFLVCLILGEVLYGPRSKEKAKLYKSRTTNT